MAKSFNIDKSDGAYPALIFSLTALILYFPANLYPFMSIQMYGNLNRPTVWQGVRSLYLDGSFFLAFIVLFASIVIPFVKIISLFYLTCVKSGSPHFKMRLSQFIGLIGRWSMLDIFLLAILVALLKLGPWTTVQPEVGSILFALVVIFTMLASASFKPQIPRKEDEKA